MRKKFTLRVFSKKEDLRHDVDKIRGYIKVIRLVPQLFEVEYTESEGREQAVKNALTVIQNTDKTKIVGHDIIEKNQLTEF